MGQPEMSAQLTRHIDSLRPRADNPRGEISDKEQAILDLRDSIIDKGVLEPLLISPDGEIWAGHRRRVASRLAYKKTRDEKFLLVPVVLRELRPGEEPIELMLHENMQRKSLSLAEEARGFLALMKAKNLNVVQLARTLKVTTATVSNRLAITRTAPEVQALFDADLLPLLSAGHLCKVTDHAAQLKYANMLVRHQINVSELDELVRKEVTLAIERCAPAVRKMYDKNELPIQAAPYLSKMANPDLQLSCANKLMWRQITVPELEEIARHETVKGSGSSALKKAAPKPEDEANVHVQQSLTRRGKQKHSKGDKPAPPRLEPTRAEAVAALARRNGSSIKLFDIRVLTETVCNACGMIDNPDVCRTCPLPRLLMGIAGRAN